LVIGSDGALRTAATLDRNGRGRSLDGNVSQSSI
jgi:hypothetical protein